MATRGYLLEGDAGEIMNGITKLATVTGINLKSTGATSLYTVPEGKTLYITEIVLRITDASSLISGPTASVGKSAAYTEWLASTALGALNATGAFKMLSHVGTGLISQCFAAGDVVALNVIVGAVATTLTGAVDVYGYLI